MVVLDRLRRVFMRSGVFFFFYAAIILYYSQQQPSEAADVSGKTNESWFHQTQTGAGLVLHWPENGPVEVREQKRWI